MKRFLCIILILLLAVPLCSCARQGNSIQSPVSFYYLRGKYSYGEADAVIVPESREAAGHLEDLSYLLNLYLQGPSNEDLVSPFPDGVELTGIQRQEQALTLSLSGSFASLTGMELTLACACLTKTCLSLTDASQVTVVTGSETQNGVKPITMDETTLLLYDSATAEPE